MDNYSLSDIAAVTGGERNGMGFGGDWSAWIILFLLFGLFGRGGFGFGGYGGDQGGAATRADINEGFALNGLQSGIHAIQQGICDSTYAINNAVTGGFSNLSSQLAECCCENRAAIAQVRYDMATQASETRHAIADSTKSIIDFLVQDKISTLQAENQNLKLAASQANQNAVLMAAMDANTAQIIRRTGNDCPIPAYVVNPPVPQTFGCGCGCGGYNG